MMSQPDNEQNRQPPGFQEGAYAVPPPASSSAPVVLVVDDHPWIRRAVGRKLQNAGYEVIVVPTAADALILAHRVVFHVLVLDLHLPDDSDPFYGVHDGFSLLDWLKRQLGELRFKIVVHTSQGSTLVSERAEQYGVFAVCYKNRDLTNLLNCVTRAVEALQAPSSEEAV